MVPSEQPRLGGVPEAVLRAIDGQHGAGAERIDDAAERYRGPYGVRLGNQEGVNAIEAEREIGGTGGAPGMLPGEPGGVGLGGGVRILSGQQLERVDPLGGERIPQRETVALAEELIDAAAGVIRVDNLRRIRVERVRIDIGA